MNTTNLINSNDIKNPNNTSNTTKPQKTIMKYADISNFYKISDYLPILNGCINAELTVMYIAYITLYLTIGNTDALKLWHDKYTLTLSIWTISTMMIILVLTRLFYTLIFNEFTVYRFTFLSVIVQLVYDIFYFLIFYHKLPKAFKLFNYLDINAEDVSYRTSAESITSIILASFLSSNFATYQLNSNLVLLIVSVYFIPFFIYNS
jgi:hypothetical protein